MNATEHNISVIINNSQNVYKIKKMAGFDFLNKWNYISVIIP